MNSSLRSNNRSKALSNITPQPLVACLIGGTALCGMALTGGDSLRSWAATNTQELILVAAVALVMLADQFPIHVRHNTKVQMTTVAIFLLAVLLPPPLAALAAGIAMFAGEMSVQHIKGNYPSDIATDIGRWMITALVGSVTIRLIAPQLGPNAAFALGALMMWTCDMVTAPATLSPMSGEKPIPVLIATVKEAGYAEGAQYVIGILAAILAQNELWTVLLLVLPAAAVQIATKRSKELHDGTQLMLENLADTVDLRDTYTGGHSRRVTALAEGILQELKYQGPEVRLIVTAARLHDIGKIAVPDEILNKPGKLTPEEWNIMASHSEAGADFLVKHPGFRRGVDIVRHHHEAWDGSGYPHKLRGTEIPFGSRVIAVADTFDAMTSDRPYRRGMPARKAIEILREGRGVQWDAQIVDAFVRSMKLQLDEEQPPQLRIVTPTGTSASTPRSA